MANPHDGRFSRGQLLGWALGAACGTLPPSAFQIYVLTYAPGFNPTYAAVYTIELTIAGSLMGGGLGYVFAFFLDLPFEPPGARRAAFLFSFTFTMLIYSLISFPLLSFVDANFSLRSLLLPAIAFISALLAGCLKGVINNLRIERQKGDPDEGTVIKRTSPRSRE